MDANQEAINVVNSLGNWDPWIENDEPLLSKGKVLIGFNKELNSDETFEKPLGFIAPIVKQDGPPMVEEVEVVGARSEMEFEVKMETPPPAERIAVITPPNETIKEDSEIMPTAIDIVCEKSDQEIFSNPDKRAEPKGGTTKMYQIINTNLKYPAAAQRANVIGKVFVRLIINEKGHVEDSEILKGIGFGCDEEAIRVVKLLEFEPAKFGKKKCK